MHLTPPFSLFSGVLEEGEDAEVCMYICLCMPIKGRVGRPFKGGGGGSGGGGGGRVTVVSFVCECVREGGCEDVSEA